MIPRQIASTLVGPTFAGNPADHPRVRLLMGPRGVGKTTLIQSVLPTGWTFLDEIHARPRWSDELRGKYESAGPNFHAIVSGSAQLDQLPHASRSLEGMCAKYFLFPLTLSEAFQSSPGSIETAPPFGEAFVERKMAADSTAQATMLDLLAYSGFPGAYSSKKPFDGFEDLQPLSPKARAGNLKNLIRVIAQKVGTPVTVNGLKEASGDTYHQTDHGLELLRLGLVTFEVRPYAKKMPKDLAKEMKLYLFNWTLVSDEAARFENYVANELNARVHLWNATCLAHFELRTIRREAHLETDFLIVRERKPWLLLEASLTPPGSMDPHLEQARALGNVPFVQVVKEDKLALRGPGNNFLLSASRLFI